MHRCSYGSFSSFFAPAFPLFAMGFNYNESDNLSCFISPATMKGTIVLDDSMAMVEGMGLANFDEVVVIARLSQSGLVTREIGDYEAVSSIVNLKKDRGIIELNVKNAVSK